MADFPTLAQIIDQHERVYSPFVQRDYCTCGDWSDDSRHDNGHATHAEVADAAWNRLRVLLAEQFSEARRRC